MFLLGISAICLLEVVRLPPLKSPVNLKDDDEDEDDDYEGGTKRKPKRNRFVDLEAVADDDEDDDDDVRLFDPQNPLCHKTMFDLY